MLKVLMTGNPTYGLAEKFSIVHTQTDFASRTNNYDLCTKQGRVKLAQSSLNCDVFINSSALYQFNQSLVLETVWKKWKEQNKKGHIINIGSTVDRSTKGAEWIYPQEPIGVWRLNLKKIEQTLKPILFFTIPHHLPRPITIG